MLTTMQLTRRPNHSTGINWPTTAVLIVMHLGAAAALFQVDWRDLATAALLYGVATGLGISMGYHRLHTHRSYNVPKPIEYLFGIFGTLALEGGPISWVATHRIHHQNSDRPGDPHSPRDGRWWAHAGWIMFGESNHSNTRKMAKYAPDLARFPFYVWLNNYHWIPTVVLALLLFWWGGAPFVLWGISFRIVFGLNATWLVNSATHLWGRRRFATRDDSRNTWWVALLTFGEGWHNNHHAFPTSARHGLAWYELDVSWIQIRLLQLLGIARSIRCADIAARPVEREAA